MSNPLQGVPYACDSAACKSLSMTRQFHTNTNRRSGSRARVFNSILLISTALAIPELVSSRIFAQYTSKSHSRVQQSQGRYNSLSSSSSYESEDYYQVSSTHNNGDVRRDRTYGKTRLDTTSHGRQVGKRQRNWAMDYSDYDPYDYDDYEYDHFPIEPTRAHPHEPPTPIDLSDFDLSSPFIPDASEREEEEKIIMALCENDDDVSNHHRDGSNARDDSGRSSSRHREQKKKGRKRKKRRRKKSTNKTSSTKNELAQTKNPIGITPPKSKHASSGTIGSIAPKNPPKQNEEKLTTSFDKNREVGVPAPTMTPSVFNSAVSSPSPATSTVQKSSLTAESRLSPSARQNLTSTVDESLSRLKRMNDERKLASSSPLSNKSTDERASHSNVDGSMGERQRYRAPLSHQDQHNSMAAQQSPPRSVPRPRPRPGNTQKAFFPSTHHPNNMSSTTPSTKRPTVETRTSTKNNINKPVADNSNTQQVQLKNQQANRTLPTTMSLTTPWARKFILSRPKDALLPIPREFLSDGFNLVQLAPIVERAVAAIEPLDNDGSMSNGAQQAHTVNQDGAKGRLISPTGGDNDAPPAKTSGSLYKAALRMILDIEGKANENTTPGTSDNGNLSPSSASSRYTPSQIQKAAEVLYTLVHARYVSSPRGLDTIRRMFMRNNESGCEAIFGRCPRTMCNGMPLLPYGMSNSFDIGGKGGAGRKAMRYCRSCGEAFYMWESKIDGSAWGSSFAHLFLMAHGSEVFSTKSLQGSSGHSEIELNQPIAKIFGFPIHPAADMNRHKK